MLLLTGLSKRLNYAALFSITCLLSAFFAAIPSAAQSNQNQDNADVVTLDMRNCAYRQGEVLVKFKTSSGISVRRSAAGRFISANKNSVNATLSKLGVTSVESLMPLSGSKSAPSKVRSLHGDEVNVKDLSQLYHVKFDATKVASVHEAVAQLKELDDVEFAEPNYLVYTLDTGDNLKYALGPLYIKQWDPAAINLPALWEKKTINTKRQVIAILDTGVDITHPDLKDNIWTNTAESAGAEGSDDDGNGFVDDVNGYDFVNQSGKMRDNNGHGTHCAGIAAASGGNGIGITGANPDAYIMPVTVMQSDGVGDVATIIKGIDYAVANGADVISMSFGGYSYSIIQ